MQTRSLVLSLASALIAAAFTAAPANAARVYDDTAYVPAASADEVCHPFVKPCRPVLWAAPRADAVAESFRGEQEAAQAVSGRCHYGIFACNKRVVETPAPAAALAANR